MARLHVRLDPERRRRLEELAEEKGAPISEVVRRLIDDAYQGIMQERRRQAVRRLTSLEIEVTLPELEAPAIDALSRELDGCSAPAVIFDR